jgi:hypothetical protein
MNALLWLAGIIGFAFFFDDHPFLCVGMIILLLIYAT